MNTRFSSQQSSKYSREHGGHNNETALQLPRIEVPKRLVTLVEGLDEILYGGIPAGNAVLVSGVPGAGKSLTLRQIAMTLVALGIPTVYYTAEEHPSEVIESFREFFGFDAWPYVRARLLKFVYLCYSCPKSSRYFSVIPLSGTKEGERFLRPYQLLIDDIYNSAKRGYSFIIIDSVTPLWADAPSTGRKIMIQLHSALKNTKMTALITTQVSREEEGFGGPGVEHASDGLIMMNVKYYEGMLRRTIRIRKMRGTKHTLWTHEYAIGDGEITIDWQNYVFGERKLYKKEMPRDVVEEMRNAVKRSYEEALSVLQNNKVLFEKLNVPDDIREVLVTNFEEALKAIESVIKDEGDKEVAEEEVPEGVREVEEQAEEVEEVGEQ